MASKKVTQQVVSAVSTRFRTFGGGRGSTTNPIAAALRDQPAQFAAGVDVEEVVTFVLKEHARQLRLKTKERRETWQSQ